MTLKKWDTISSKHVLVDKWIKVRADHCVDQFGNNISPYYVLDYPEWVKMVVLTPDNGLVMIKQYRHGAGVIDWEIPAGNVEPGDTDYEGAARRELLEETGFSAKQFELVTLFSPNTANHSNNIHLYLVRDAVKTQEPEFDETENIITEVMPIPKVLEMIKSSGIKQSTHISCLLVALSHANLISLEAKAL